MGAVVDGKAHRACQIRFAVTVEVGDQKTSRSLAFRGKPIGLKRLAARESREKGGLGSAGETAGRYGNGLIGRSRRDDDQKRACCRRGEKCPDHAEINDIPASRRAEVGAPYCDSSTNSPR